MRDVASGPIKVLVPIDFSTCSRRALDWAFDHATRTPVEIHVAHIVEDHLGDMLPGNDRFISDLSSVMRDASRELERVAPSAAQREKIGHITRHVVRGRAAPEILKLADELGVGMIVIGTHGRTGLAHLLLGSVAEKVVRQAACPVVVVPDGKRAKTERS